MVRTLSELAQRVAVLEEREDTNLGARILIVEQTINKISNVDFKIKSTLDKLSNIETQSGSHNQDIVGIKHDIKEMQNSQRSIIRSFNNFQSNHFKDLEEYKLSIRAMIQSDKTLQDHNILGALNANSNSSAHQQSKENVTPNHVTEQRINSWLGVHPPAERLDSTGVQEPRIPVYGLTTFPSSKTKVTDQEVVGGAEVFTTAIPQKKNIQSLRRTKDSGEPSIGRDDCNASISQVSSNVSALNFQEKLLRTNTKCLRKLLAPKPCNSLSKCTI